MNPAWLVIGAPCAVFVICAAWVAVRELGKGALHVIIAFLWGDGPWR